MTFSACAHSATFLRYADYNLAKYHNRKNQRAAERQPFLTHVK